MPFGLCNTAQTQQRLVDSLFGLKYEPHIFSYLDDIILLSKTFEEHVQLLKVVNDILRDTNVIIHSEKCEFIKSSLKYLGFVIDRNGIRTYLDKVSAMVNFKRA